MNIVVDYNISDTDYVKDGVLHVGPDYSGNVQVSAETDLAPISATGYYNPGALAHTAGWGAVWELDADETTWAPMT